MALIENVSDLAEALANSTDLRRVNEDRDLQSFGWLDISTIEWMSVDSPEGYASLDVLAYGESWLYGYWLVEAWCDTSGWDCQSGGSIRVARTLDDLIRFGMSEETRRLANLALGDGPS